MTSSARPPLLALLLAALASAPLAPQEQAAPHAREPGRVLARVVDSQSGEPVEGVAVELRTAEGLAASTDEEGRFELDGVPPLVHEIELRHVAYGTRSELVNVPPGRTVELQIALPPKAIGVEPLEVTVRIRHEGLERHGYYHREELGFGTHFGPRETDRRTFIGMLREVPGLRLASSRSSFRHHPYFRRGLRHCTPMLVIDERPIRLRGMAIEDLVDRRNVLAMEVYRPGDTPGRFQYQFHRDCGAVVIWTHLQSR